MQRSLFAPALVAITSLTLACGCGTVVNLASDNPTVYGGVRRDLETASTLKIPIEGKSQSDAIGAAVILGVCVGELLVTATADTLTAPYLAYRNGKKAREETRESMALPEKGGVRRQPFVAGAAVVAGPEGGS